jgi:hypothetical protein
MSLFVTLLACAPAFAQDFTQRGTLEYRGWLFPQTTAYDRGHAVGEALFRYEFSRSLIRGLKLYGTTETRIDTHHQVERDFEVNFADRTRQRPAFNIRRASILYSKGKFTAEAGKQLIRWGKTEILTPTDRFAPRDFLAVVDTEFLHVLAGRASWEGKSNSIEVVLQPRFTPSRVPLINQRWSNFTVPVHEVEPRYPGGPQYGLRWKHLGSRFDASLSMYEGHNHLPLFDREGQEVRRYYPHLRLVGGDAEAPLSWFTIKGEAAWFTSKTAAADEYVLYVIQLEREFGDASIVGGYSGEAITRKPNPFDFAPDRGLARSFLGRATYAIDPRRNVAAEWAVRQNGDGLWTRFEYSQSYRRGWRAIAGLTLIRGDPADFLGQYRRNSHVSLILRYTF